MAFTDTVNSLFANIGVGLPEYVLICTLLSSLIFIAIDTRLGILLAFFLVGCETLVFYSIGNDITSFVAVLFAMFVILALSLFISYSKQSRSVV